MLQAFAVKEEALFSRPKHIFGPGWTSAVSVTVAGVVVSPPVYLVSTLTELAAGRLNGNCLSGSTSQHSPSGEP